MISYCLSTWIFYHQFANSLDLQHLSPKIPSTDSIESIKIQYNDEKSSWSYHNMIDIYEHAAEKIHEESSNLEKQNIDAQSRTLFRMVLLF